MFTAICEKNCTFHGKYWEKGEVYKGKAEPPAHFRITERPKAEEPKKPEEPPRKNEGDKGEGKK